MRLDSANDVEIGLRRLHRGIDIDAIRTVELRIVMPLEPTDEIGRQERIDARLRWLRDKIPEARQRHAGRTALIDQGRHAGLHADHVRVHSEAAGDVLIDMRMRIDQPGQHQLAGDVDHLSGAGRQNVGLYGGDLAIADGDVPDPIDARGRADHAAAAQKLVESGADRHERSPLSSPGGAYPRSRQNTKHTSYLTEANF